MDVRLRLEPKTGYLDDLYDRAASIASIGFAAVLTPEANSRRSVRSLSDPNPRLGSTGPALAGPDG